MSDNIYYSPEKFGLEVIAHIDWDNEAYQFNQTVVWRDKKTGQVYMAHDSGCSCPSPFENFNSVDDLEKLDSISQITYLIKEKEEYRDKYGRNSYNGPTKADTDRFMNEILKAISLFGGD